MGSNTTAPVLTLEELVRKADCCALWEIHRTMLAGVHHRPMLFVYDCFCVLLYLHMYTDAYVYHMFYAMLKGDGSAFA